MLQRRMSLTDTPPMERLPLADRGLLQLFRFVGRLLLLQGAATACGALAVAPFAAEPLVWRPLLFVAFVSALFLVAGLIVRALDASPIEPPAASRPGAGEALLFGVSVVAMAALTLFASTGLPPLWRDISARLSAVGFWNEVQRSSQAGGILMLPILVGLAVPTLVTLTAAFSFIVAPVLLVRHRSGSPASPRLAGMGAAVQAALAGGGWLAGSALRQVSELFTASAASAADLEVQQLAGELAAAVAVLDRAATWLVAPTLLLAGWAAHMLWHQESRLPSARSAGGTGEASPVSRASQLPRAEPLLQGAAGPLLAALGIAMLLFAGADRLRSRAVYVSSTPEAGASTTVPPPAVRVTFSQPLDAASTLSLVYVPLVPSLTDISRDVEGRSRLLSDRRTLEVIPPLLGRGVYLARWLASPESGGVARVGSLAFAVGAPLPPDSGNATYSLIDRDSDRRGRRSIEAGGILLLVLAVLAWSRHLWLPSGLS